MGKDDPARADLRKSRSEPSSKKSIADKKGSKRARLVTDGNDSKQESVLRKRDDPTSTEFKMETGDSKLAEPNTNEAESNRP